MFRLGGFQVVLTFGVLLTAYLLASLVGRGFDEEVLRGVERVSTWWTRGLRWCDAGGYYHHTNNEKVSQMRTESFSLVGLDLDDPEAVEMSWNRWVGELFHEGYRPSDMPVSWTDTEVTYNLMPIGGVSDFNQEHSLAGAA